MRALRPSRCQTQGGKDIWLFGGGLLFRSLLKAGLVDTVEVGASRSCSAEGRPQEIQSGCG
jgi:dihydrofolate reductase